MWNPLSEELREQDPRQEQIRQAEIELLLKIAEREHKEQMEKKKKKDSK